MRIKKTIISLVILAQIIPIIGLVALPSSLSAQEIPTTQDGCNAVGGTWTPSTGAGTTDSAGGTCQPKSNPAQAASCSFWRGTWTFESCIWNPLMSAIGAFFLGIGAGILGLAGAAFDASISYVVIDYAGTLQKWGLISGGSEVGAIEKGWTVFRDFSNILIIGFFVFIAISIILGLQEFGQKRLIANVLVIAVLMNFSLLFAKVVIDGSNFFAYQIYSQMARTSGNGQQAKFDIAAAFLKPMKIQGVYDTEGLYNAASAATKNSSGVMAVFFGIVGMIMLIAVAIVLLYASFLIVWRGILFIMLMLAAPIAFATYLMPNLAHGEFGWNSWWKMLINNAAFGPLLMILLALALSIINAAGSTTSTTTSIGDVVSNPNMGNGAWGIIMVYFVGLGVLFASIKMANSFAASIGTYGAGANLAKLGARFSVGKTSNVIGRGLRNSVGKVAADDSKAAALKIQNLNSQLLKTTDAAQRKSLQSQIEAATKAKLRNDKLASRDFNFLATGAGKALGAQLGMEAAKSIGGYTGPRKKAAEEAAKLTSDLTPKKEDVATLAREQAQKEVASQKADLEKQQRETESRRADADSFEKTQKALAEERARLKEQLDSEMATHAAMETSGTGNMGEQQNKIKTVAEALTAAQRKLDDHAATKPADFQSTKDIDAKLSQLREQSKKVEAEVANKTVELSKKIIDTHIDSVSAIGANLVHSHDTFTNDEIKETVRKNYKNKSIRERIKQEKELEKEIIGDSSAADKKKDA